MLKKLFVFQSFAIFVDSFEIKSTRNSGLNNFLQIFSLIFFSLRRHCTRIYASFIGEHLDFYSNEQVKSRSKGCSVKKNSKIGYKC